MRTACAQQRDQTCAACEYTCVLLTYLQTYLRAYLLTYAHTHLLSYTYSLTVLILTHLLTHLLTYRGIYLHYQADDTKRHVREQLPVVVELRGQLRL